MAEGLNRWTGIGNLGADPELRVTQGGQPILHMRIACSESYLDKDKVRRERTEWINLTMFGKRGEALAKILTKGSTIYAEGSLRSSSYEDRDGKKVWKTEVILSNVIPTNGRGGARGTVPDDAGDDGQSEQRAAQRDTGKRTTRNGPPPDDDRSGGYGGDDDIPF